MIITPDILRRICPTLGPARANALAPLFNEICPKYGINTPDRMEEFIATLAEESGEFSHKSEALSYSAPRLRQVWPARFPTDAKAAQYARNPIALANYVYANRMGNGGPETGDGYKYRGGGFIQLTGKSMYLAYAKYLKQPIDTVSELVHTTDRYALDSACWFFTQVAGLNDEADRDEFITITKRVNGGLTNFEKRKEYLKRAKAALNS